MYSENICKHHHKCHQGKTNRARTIDISCHSIISKWRKWDWEIIKMVKTDRNDVFVENTFSYITIEHLDIVQMSPFQITLEGCQMKMFRPSWWLEKSTLEDISRNWDIFYYFNLKVWIMTISQKGNRSGNEKLKTQPRLLGECFELIMVPTMKQHYEAFDSANSKIKS